MAEKIRLQKYISSAGVASRRKAEEMIRAGRVKVNGKVSQIGDSILAGKDTVTLDGDEIAEQTDKIYIMLHKPRGFITTLSDEKGRKTVSMLVEDIPGRIYPVGRLDKDSEGMLIMTNDGEFANMILHPKTHVSKTYRVTVRPGINEEQLNRITTGIIIDGRKTAPARVRVLEHQEGRVVLEIILYEGRNREIRKMCEAVGLEVARLKRTAIGPVKLSMLQQGKYRELTKEEIKALSAAAKKGENKDDRNSADGRQRKRDGVTSRDRNQRRQSKNSSDDRRRR